MTPKPEISEISVEQLEKYEKAFCKAAMFARGLGEPKTADKWQGVADRARAEIERRNRETN
jgi:hypothetical protein